MTEFTVDIHPVFQAGLSVQTLVDGQIAALACKVTEGSGWYRAAYHDFSAAAKRAGLLFCSYHFLRSESSGQAQAAWCKKSMGPDWGAVPVMLDWETSVAGTRADVATANAFITEVRRLGGRIELNYLPRWYWSAIGSPSLTSGPVSTLALVQSSYGSNAPGSPTDLYPGDHSSRWAGFGGLPVSLLQFGSNARLAGYSGPLDINAYRGDRAELARTGWFYDPQEDDMTAAWGEEIGSPALGKMTRDEWLKGGRAAAVEAKSARAEVAGLATQLAGMRTTIEALAEAVAAGGGDIGTAAILDRIDEQSEQTRTAVAALQADIDQLQEEKAELQRRLAAALGE